MKKNTLLICLIFTLVLCIVFSSCNKNNNNDIKKKTEYITDNVLQTVSNVYENEETTDKIFDPVLPGKLAFNVGEYTYEIVKTDFESRYSEEFLLEAYSVVSMSFGYEDYYNWNGDAEKAVNELINNCLSTSKFPFKAIETEDEELLEKASEELRIILNDDSINLGGGIVEIEVLNSYIKDMFGENARTFAGEDFITVEEAILQDGKIFSYHREGYSLIRYLPESDLLYFSSRDTGFSCVGSFICDIKEENGDYIMYTVGDVEDYGFGKDFFSQQAYMFDCLSCGSSCYLPMFVYTLGVNENGDTYLKNVETKCLYANGFSGDYRVTDDAVLYDKRLYTQPFIKVGTVAEGTVVSIGKSYIKDDFEYIINEEFAGYIDPIYLEKIE